ncbi:glycoside hydrolase family 13 protein [Scleroderma yunnanense]
MESVKETKSWAENPQLASIRPSLPRMQLSPDGQCKDNPVMIQFFTWEAKHPEMSWWDHFADESPRLADLGVTLAWLPPPNKAMREAGQGYDAYDLWDIGEFDQKGTIATRWGTKEQLIQSCSIAKQHGVGVLIDAVLNHKLGADRVETFTVVSVDPWNRLRDISPEKEIRGWTAFDFPGRQGKYSELKWTQEHFTGIDWDDLNRTNGVYRITTPGHKGWSPLVSDELGNYDYLLGSDIDHSHPQVREDMFSWSSWILEETGATGYRLDAIKHIDREFLFEFINRSREPSSREKLFCVSEFWSGNINVLLPYVIAFQGETAFFDVPLHDNFSRASKEGSSYDLRHIFDNTLVAIRPADAVTFQIGQSLESWVDKDFKAQAYSLILLRPDGFPCIFYGDLYPNLECYDHDTAVILRQLILARKNFAHGPVVDYFEHKNCIGFVRSGSERNPGCAVVVSNNASGPSNPTIRMHVGKAAAGATYSSILDTSKQLTIDSEGYGDFYSSCNSVGVWVDARLAC